MQVIRTIAYILAALAIVFGFLFVLGAFSPSTPNPAGWILTGSILILVAFALIWGASRIGAQTSPGLAPNTTLKIDLPADVDIERFKCADCGAQLSMDNVKMVAGAPMVDCPYCGAAYQLSEAPKW